MPSFGKQQLWPMLRDRDIPVLPLPGYNKVSKLLGERPWWHVH